MAKIGWLVEGETEERVLPSLIERHLRTRAPALLQQRVLGRVIPDGGGKIRNPAWVEERARRLRQGKHRWVLVVADQEKFPSPEAVRRRLEGAGVDAVFVASPRFERWLLADPEAVRVSLGRTRPPDWRDRDPIGVLKSLKPSYKKVADGTLLGAAASANAWAEEEPEFCALLQCIESWLGLEPTACQPSRHPEGRPAKSNRHSRRKK